MQYFDHNATSPLCAAARQAWLEAVDRFAANPSSPHRLGARAERALDEARHGAAALLGASPFDLVWTSGATEAANAILHHAAEEAVGEVWVSALEHPCVLAAARRWFEGRVVIIPATREGVTDVNWLADRLPRGRPALVAVMAANNETGILQPWKEVLALCREHTIRFACDAAQWIGKLPAQGLGQADFVFGAAHKFGGPAGVGFMKVPAKFRPQMVGGPQEGGRRAGTENVAGVLALMAAWRLREEQIAAGGIDERREWRDAFIRSLREAGLEMEVLGERSERLWNTVAVLMPPLADCRRRWVVQLDKLGFAVSTGSACASGKAQASHVILAMGRPAEAGERMVRMSGGWETEESGWQLLREAIAAAARAPC